MILLEELSTRLPADRQRGRLKKWDEIGAFVLAGNATFTLVSVDTSNRFTYRVRRAKELNKKGCRPWFVSLLRGPNNEEDYTYMGVVEDVGAQAGEFKATAKSRVGVDALSHKAFQFFWKRLQAGGAPCRTLEFWHEGACGRCGRKLTVPRSVKLGIGPECEGGRAAATP